MPFFVFIYFSDYPTYTGFSVVNTISKKSTTCHVSFHKMLLHHIDLSICYQVSTSARMHRQTDQLTEGQTDYTCIAFSYFNQYNVTHSVMSLKFVTFFVSHTEVLCNPLITLQLHE